LTIVGIISGLAAQVPKRFLFRKRPYMVGRALPVKKTYENFLMKCE